MPVPCARCNMPLPKWSLARGGDADCPSCGAPNSVRLYPAALTESAAAHPEAALEGEAACFDHPGTRAVAACRQCGRFVCELCAVRFGAEVWCPSCVANSSGTPGRANAVASRTLYDTIAFSIPFALLVVWPLTILSAPIVAALAVMKWKQPIGLVRCNRWRFVAGLAAFLIQGGLWAWWIWYAVARSRAGA
ncbi:MAG TPA: hypothetical protein VGF59_06430 [Bryobacteraceae bacterium]